MFLPVFVCLSVCLSVSNITQKRVHGFGWNVACRLSTVWCRDMDELINFWPRSRSQSGYAGTALLSPISYRLRNFAALHRLPASCTARRNFTYGKSHERAVVLKWFYSLSSRNTFVGSYALSAPLSALLVVVFRHQTLKLWTCDRITLIWDTKYIGCEKCANLTWKYLGNESSTGSVRIKYPNTKIANRAYLRNAWLFLRQISLICLAQNNALMCCFVLYSLDIRKLTETQPSRTNFTTEQKVYFIIKIIERRVQPVVTLLNFYVYVQRSTVINFSIFQVVG